MLGAAMRLTALVCATALWAAPACGDDDGVVPGDGGPPDASLAGDAAPIDAAVPPDFACLATPPTTAPDPIEIGGTVALDGSANGVTVELRRSDDDGLLGQAAADDAGHFTMSVATGGVPVEAYLAVAGGGAMPTRRAWAGPFAVDAPALGVALWSEAQIAQATGNVGVVQQTGDGILIMTVRDCGGALVTGATVSLSPARGALYYAGFQQPYCWPYNSVGGTTGCGMIWVFNLPAGAYQAGVSWGGDPVATLPVTIAANAVYVVSTDVPR